MAGLELAWIIFCGICLIGEALGGWLAIFKGKKKLVKSLPPKSPPTKIPRLTTGSQKNHNETNKIAPKTPISKATDLRITPILMRTSTFANEVN